MTSALEQARNTKREQLKREEAQRVAELFKQQEDGMKVLELWSTVQVVFKEFHQVNGIVCNIDVEKMIASLYKDQENIAVASLLAGNFYPAIRWKVGESERSSGYGDDFANIFGTYMADYVDVDDVV